MLWYRMSFLAVGSAFVFLLALIASHLSWHAQSAPAIASATVNVVTASAAPAATAESEELRVIDIRRADAAALPLTEIIGISPHDQIVSVNDLVAAGDQTATINTLGKESATYIDIGVRRRGKRIRMIVLLH